MTLTIRKEHPGDHQAIHDVTAAAFADAPHTDHNEQHIVAALRAAGALSVSLVAEDAGTLVGHVALSPVSISDGAQHWYGLGPVSVVPDYQGKGIGTALMDAAIQALHNLNASGCVLLGEPDFYQRFGFIPCADLVLAGVPPEYFMCLHLRDAMPAGEVTYHAAFAVGSGG